MKKINPSSKPDSVPITISINEAKPFQFQIINKFNIIAAAIALSLSGNSGKVWAACMPAPGDGITTNCDTSSVQTNPVGDGPGLNNTIINVLPSAQINTGESTAISVDSNATIILQDDALVQNATSSLAGTGFWLTGENTIEFNDNTILTVAHGAQLLALGPTASNEAINVQGDGNVIINHGLIQGNVSSAIWFQPSPGNNTIDNYGTISMTVPTRTVIGSSGTSVYIINRSGASIIGNVSMGSGDDALTLESGSVLQGNISGGGGFNSLFLGGAATGSPATLDLLSGNITSFQALTKNDAGEWRLTGNLSDGGAGGPLVVTVNDGTLLFTGNNTYSGDTIINGGTLAAGAPNTFTPASAYTIASAGTLDLRGFNQTIGSVSNAGTIDINGAGGTVLTVMNDYNGNNGNLNFNAHLSDDASNSERLIVGGSTSGNTRVSVNNIGGSGAATINGIELITVNGASDGDFLQSGRIVAGAYDYALKRGTGTNAANWYLNSSTAAPGPGTGTEPVPVPVPVPVPIPDPHPAPDTMVERPEDSSYATNLAAANTLFNAGRDVRSGMTPYIDPITGAQKSTSLWMINEGGHNRSRDDSGQLRTQSNRYVLQLGGDIGRWSSNSLDSFQLGVMAGYGNARSNTDSQVSGYSSKGSVDGYSVGLYGTWYANAADRSGLYIDTWTQYGWFDNEVKGQDLNEEDYNSKGFTASLESGYAFKLGENVAKNTAYFIQPQAQAIWMDVQADDHTEANGTRVTGDGDGNIQTRLGVKAYMNTYSERDKDKDRAFQPYVEANWIHNSDDFGATLNGVEIKQSGAANIGEIKLGVDGKINKNFNLWGNVGQQVGNKGYSDTGGMIGVKYLF